MDHTPLTPDELADRRHFVLPPAQWDAFVALLDAPVEPCPKLVELFARPKRIDTEANMTDEERTARRERRREGLIRLAEIDHELGLDNEIRAILDDETG